jgi:YebC/PmpR family DNA-binding regulatory protein
MHPFLLYILERQTDNPESKNNYRRGRRGFHLMAGHSKWAQIKRSKAVKDAKRGANFAKMSKDIIVATKLGGPDPAGNFRLRTAIDKAKAAGMPNDNIYRAIDKGAGRDGADDQESLTYEGYGPGGVAIFIEAMTDNRNRTAGDVRSYFKKCDGNLGTDGCVAWIFNEKGLVKVSQEGVSEELLFERSAEAGAEDITTAEDDTFEIITPTDVLNQVCQALQEREPEIPIISAEVTRFPENSVQVTDETRAKQLFKLLDALENHDDVQDVYANFEMDDALLEQLGE